MDTAIIHRLCCGVMRPAGVEPATLGSEVRCSVQLNYGRVKTTLSNACSILKNMKTSCFVRICRISGFALRLYISFFITAFFEFSNALAQRPGQIRQFTRAKKQKNNHKHKNNFRQTNA